MLKARFRKYTYKTNDDGTSWCYFWRLYIEGLKLPATYVYGYSEYPTYAIAYLDKELRNDEKPYSSYEWPSLKEAKEYLLYYAWKQNEKNIV